MRSFLFVISAAVFVVVANGGMVNVAIPTIGEDYGTSEAQTSWVITAYLLVFAVGIPLYGRLADIYSLKKAFAVGLAAFAAGSLACALAPSLLLLVGGRIVQAAGAGAIPALASASVAKLLPPGERGGALGLISSSVGIGAAVGPVAGGALVQFAGWHALFYGTLTLGLVLLVGALYVLPDSRAADTGKSFDLPGGLLLAAGAGLALFGVTEGQVAGFASPLSWGSFVVSAAAIGAFWWRISHFAEPFVSPRLFGNRAYVTCAAVGFFAMFANLAAVIFVPLLISDVNSLSAGVAGLVLAPGAVAVAILSPLAGRLSDRFTPRPLVLSGVCVMLVSTLALSTFGVGASPLVVAAGMLGLGIGFSGLNSPNTNAAAATLPDAEIGVGLGIYQMMFFLGGGFGPALLGAFLAFRRETSTAALNPFYDLGATPFSDAFLVMSLCLAVSLFFLFTLPRVKSKP